MDYFGSSPTGFGAYTDGEVNFWGLNSFRTTTDVIVGKVRIYLPAAGALSAAGESLPFNIWTTTGGDAITSRSGVFPLSDTPGWVTVTLDTPIMLSAGVYLGIEYQLKSGFYVAKTMTDGTASNGIVFVGSQYSGDYGHASSFLSTNGSRPAQEGFMQSLSYGVDFETIIPALTFTTARLSNSSVSISWDASDSTITDGITIVRGSGDLSAASDGAGKTPGSDGYDPTTIAGVAEVASGVTVSPHTDTVPSAGTYTYWINRTA